MDLVLNEFELRVLGCLVEKELTTPEYYPLTLNALLNACNQKTSREPVVNFDDKVVVRALDGLREKRLVYQDLGSGRVPKYGHNLAGVLGILRQEMALLCVLMLRGPQTPGELKTRTARMHDFPSLAEVEESIGSLAEMNLAVMLPRRPGHKENRYAQLLSGEPAPESMDFARPEAAALEVRAENGRIAVLEDEVKSLRGELDQLTASFAAFKKQFD
jgi:hypothetical protein